MNDQETASEDGFMIALASLRDAYEQAATTIQGDHRTQHAFESATALADTLRQLAENAANLRARTAARIATEEKLSLSVLAARIGVSKARAEQLIKNVKDTGPLTTEEREGTADA